MHAAPGNDGARPRAIHRRGFRQKFGIAQAAVVSACLRTLFKISPEMDKAFRSILSTHTDALLVLKALPHPSCHVGALPRARLERSLFATGESAGGQGHARVMMLPALSDYFFARVCPAVDMNLDSFPSGGHAASMDALAAFTPTVTLPHALLAGRGAQAFLAALRLPHLIARNVPEHVSIALALGTNARFQHEQHVALQQRVPSLVFGTTSVQAWAQMLELRVRGDPVAFEALLAPPA